MVGLNLFPLLSVPEGHIDSCSSSISYMVGNSRDYQLEEYISRRVLLHLRHEQFITCQVLKLGDSNVLPHGDGPPSLHDCQRDKSLLQMVYPFYFSPTSWHFSQLVANSPNNLQQNCGTFCSIGPYCEKTGNLKGIVVMCSLSNIKVKLGSLSRGWQGMSQRQ